MSWKDLDIKLKAELIKLGVRSGVRDLKLIRLLYDLELENDNIKTLQSSLDYNEELKTTPELEKNNDDLLIEMLLQEGKQINAIQLMEQSETPLFNITTGGYNNQLPVLFRQFNRGGYISNNPTLALVGKVNKFREGGYEGEDDSKNINNSILGRYVLSKTSQNNLKSLKLPIIITEKPVSESTYVLQPLLNILELELLNYLLSNPTAEQGYFRDLAIQNRTAPQSNLGVIQTKENQDLVDKAFLGYNNFRYSHPWAEGLSYTPIIGDSMDLISLAGAVNNKDYMTAGLGLGMLALPNFIEKPIKNIYKTIKPWIPDYEVVKAIKDGRFMPFLLRQNSPHILKYYNFNKNVATPIVVEDMLKYNENHITPFSDNLEYPLIKFRKSILDVPKFKVKRIPTKKNMRAYYSSINDEIVFDPRLRKEGVQGLKGFIIPESITDSLMQTIFHEHYHGSTMNKPTITSFNNDKYNGINNNNASAVRIFLPLVKNHGRWEGIPEEYIAELYGLDKVKQLTAPDMNDIDASNIIAKRLGERFNIDPEDALWMIGELDRKGYKYGGFLFPNLAFSHKFEK